MRPQFQIDEAVGDDCGSSAGPPDQVQPWHSNAQLNIDTTRFPLKRSGSSAGYTSDVNDLGDGKHLETQEGDRQPPSPNIAPASELLTETGAGLAGPIYPKQQDNAQELLNVDASEFNETLDEILRADTPEAIDPGDVIRRSLCEPNQGESKWAYLPINEVERIVTSDLVRQELVKLVNSHLTNGNHQSPVPTTPKQLDTVVSQIVSSKKEPKPATSRKKIFCILSLIMKVDSIFQFIDEDIYDNNLPIERSSLRGWQGQDHKGAKKSIKLFNKWKPHEVESFEQQQRKILVHIFDLRQPKGKVEHYKLASCIVLPYLESPEILGRGGFGNVSKVKFHPGHVLSSVPEATGSYYAVKRLAQSDYNQFKKEVNNLNRFTGRGHDHLIRLLCTFSRGDKHHLIFPLADGNLLDLWKEGHPTPLANYQDHKRVLWLSSQCKGIVDALNEIHLDINGMMSMFNSHSQSANKRHGRHGDVKPENILWFRNGVPGSDFGDLGSLKISDFGLMGFHGTLSRSAIDANKVGYSPTYRAPELDVYEKVGQSYDIWSLGCVLLEFVTWYLKGWEGVGNFSILREGEAIALIQEDNFFIFSNANGASMKKVVRKKFHELYADQNCSQFISDLLDFIETRLLRLNPLNRVSCQEVCNKLKQLHENCEKSPSYALKRAQFIVPKRANSNDSTLLPKTFQFQSRQRDVTISSRVSSRSFSPGPLKSSSTPPIAEVKDTKDSDRIDANGHTAASIDHEPKAPLAEVTEQRSETSSPNNRELGQGAPVLVRGGNPSLSAVSNGVMDVHLQRPFRSTVSGRQASPSPDHPNGNVLVNGSLRGYMETLKTKASKNESDGQEPSTSDQGIVDGFGREENPLVRFWKRFPRRLTSFRKKPIQI